MSKNLIPSLIKDIESGSVSSNPNFIGTVNGNLLFSTSNFPASNGTQLWKTNGSEAGTVLIQDYPGGNFPAGINPIASVDGAVFFFLGIDFTQSLVKSDGTESGTLSVDSVFLRSSSGFGPDFVGVGDTLFYTGTKVHLLLPYSKLITILIIPLEYIQIQLPLEVKMFAI